MKTTQDYVDEEFKKNPEEAMRLYDGKAEQDIIPLIINIQVTKRLAEIQSNAAATLKERHTHIHRFQAGNYLYWKEAFDLIEIFIATNLDIGTAVIKSFQEQKKTELDFKYKAIIENHSRACLISEEILCLLKAGFPDAALSRWRALHEIAAILLVLSKSGQQCAERYLDHDIIDHYKGLILTKELNHGLPNEGPSDQTIEHYKKLHDELLQRYGDSYKNPYGWAAEVLNHKNPQFTHIEEYAGLSHMRPQYKLASHRIHAGANGFNATLGAQQLDENVMLRAPSHDGIAGPISLCSHSLSQVTMALLNMAPFIDNMISATLLTKQLDEIDKALQNHPSSSQDDNRL